MAPDSLFEIPPPEGAPVPVPAPVGEPRLVYAQRAQQLLLPTDLESLVPADHRVRVVWAFVEGLDLSRLLGKVRSVEGHAGRPAADPRILLTLWLYATLEGVGSARALARLCEEHAAYRWICGGVAMNHHSLSDFRVGHGEVLDELLTQSVAALMAEGLADLERVAQDGVRVRASAGAASFRSSQGLDDCLEKAREQVEALKREIDADPRATSARQKAARERAARERLDRVRKALAQREEAAAKKKKGSEEEQATRASTTDPQARVMKQGDGGFRPAYNVQFASDVRSQLVVGVDVTQQGTDMGLMGPMIDQVEARYAKGPTQVLVDGGFTAHGDIEAQEAKGREVYAPVAKPRKTKEDPQAQRDPHEPRTSDTPGVARWRARMGGESAKEVYRDRASTAECVNALARNRGLRHFPVRGLAKVRAIAILFALAHNLLRGISLRAAVAGSG